MGDSGSHEAYKLVVPAKAGTHSDFEQGGTWVPAFAGMTVMWRFDGRKRKAPRERGLSDRIAAAINPE